MCQVLPMIASKNFSVRVRDQGESLMVNDSDLPGPPLEKFIHPGSCGWTRSVLKEIDDAGPEDLVVKVSIHKTPGVDTRKCEPDLQNSMLASEP